MSKSNTLAYVHPDYLTTDDVLNHIGKAIDENWDSGYIEKSRIPEQILVTQPDGSKIGIQEISMILLIPQDEEEIRRTLRNFESKIYIHKNKSPQKVSPSSFEKFFSDHDNRKSKRRVLNVDKPFHNSKPIGEIHTYEFPIQIISLIGSSQVNVIESTNKFNLESEEDRANLRNLLNLTKSINLLRDALVRGNLCSYVDEDGEYKVIHSNEWIHKKHWSRLLIEGCFNQNKGGVLFLEKDVKAFLENISLQALSCIGNQEDKGRFEKLFDPKRPWLKLTNELALSLSDAEIDTKTKKELMRDIMKKATLAGLNISQSKLDYIATTLRSPEQEKGTTHRSKLKKEKTKKKAKE